MSALLTEARRIIAKEREDQFDRLILEGNMDHDVYLRMSGVREGMIRAEELISEIIENQQN